MNNNRKTHTLLNLITDFETLIEKGEVGFFDRSEFLSLIHYYQEEQLIEKAIEVVDIALEQFKYNVEFYVAKARLLLTRNSPKLALPFIEHAEKISPYEVEVQILKAKAFSKMGITQDAKAILGNLGTVADQQIFVEIGLCESYIFEAEKDFEQMYLKLKEVLKMAPLNEEALEKINYASTLCRRFEENIDFHQSLLDINPYNYLAWYNLGQSYSSIHEYEEAIDAMEYSFLIKEDFEAGYLDSADLCMQIRALSRAVEIYRDYLSHFDKDPFVLVNLATCLKDLGILPEARKITLEAIKLDPYNDEAYYLLAGIFEEEKKWESALNAFYKAIELDDTREEYFAGLAKMYDQLNEPDKAAKYFDQVIELEPSEEHFYLDYISFLFRQKLFNKALRVIKVSEDNVYSPDIIYYKIASLWKMGKKSRVLSLLDLALEESYDNHQLLHMLIPDAMKDASIIDVIKYYKK
jgi:tetratricopeptide (TPR) repeat protein